MKRIPQKPRPGQSFRIVEIPEVCGGLTFTFHRSISKEFEEEFVEYIRHGEARSRLDRLYSSIQKRRQEVVFNGNAA